MLHLYAIPSKFCQRRVFHKSSIPCLHSRTPGVDLARHLFFPASIQKISRSYFSNPTPLMDYTRPYLQLSIQKNFHSTCLTHFKRISRKTVFNGKSNLGLLLVVVSGAILALVSTAKAEEEIKVVAIEETPVVIHRSSFKWRTVAYLLDILFVTVFATFAYAFIGNSSAIIVFLMHLFFCSQSKTMGKWLIGLHVVEKKSGKPAPLPVMIIHEILKHLGMVVIFIDVCWYYFNNDCLHNVICGTVTVDD